MASPKRETSMRLWLHSRLYRDRRTESVQVLSHGVLGPIMDHENRWVASGSTLGP